MQRMGDTLQKQDKTKKVFYKIKQNHLTNNSEKKQYNVAQTTYDIMQLKKPFCTGKCKKFRVMKPTGQGRYSSGQGRCQICDIWINYRGAHTKDGYPANIDSEGWVCNCCNYRVRRNPRNIKYKAKIRSEHVTLDNTGIDLSYFNKHRARMLKYIARCIPQSRDKFHKNRFTTSLALHGITILDIESEFNVSIETILDLAYSTNTPNKISMIVEFERVCSMLGHIPTKSEFEENSELDTLQYESEFTSWEHLLERLGYDPFYRDAKSNNTNIADSNLDETNPARPTEQASLHILNKNIKDTLHLIKASKIGAYASDLRMLLEISQDEMSATLTKIVRVEGIYRKDTLRGDGSWDILLIYDPDGTRTESKDYSKTKSKYNTVKPESKDTPSDTLHHDQITNNPDQSSTDKIMYDIGMLAQQLVDEHITNKRQIEKHLQQRLTREFVESKSMENVFRNNYEFTKSEIKLHVRTSLRLPPELEKLENEGGLHAEPNCSLQIALYAVNYYDWDGDKDKEQDVLRLAQSLSRYLHENQNLDHIFSGKIKPRKLGCNQTESNNLIIVSAAISVWIATATLHEIYGINKNFSNKDIIAKVKEQNICAVSNNTIALHVSSHCVANNKASPNTHKKLYRASRGRYRLYRRGDYYNRDRKQGQEEPDITELPGRYKYLIGWYNDRYCTPKGKI